MDMVKKIIEKLFLHSNVNNNNMWDITLNKQITIEIQGAELVIQQTLLLKQMNKQRSCLQVTTQWVGGQVRRGWQVNFIKRWNVPELYVVLWG